MTRLIVLESQDLDDASRKCTDKQYDYLRGLMSHTKHEELWLNHLQFNGQNRLSKISASKLIDCILKRQEFELRELKYKKG